MASRRSQAFSLLGASLTIQRYAQACGVSVRPARLQDAKSIIQLNKTFRCGCPRAGNAPAKSSSRRPPTPTRFPFYFFFERPPPLHFALAHACRIRLLPCRGPRDVRKVWGFPGPWCMCALVPVPVARSLRGGRMVLGVLTSMRARIRIEMSQWEQDPAGVWTPPNYTELGLECIEVSVLLPDGFPELFVNHQSQGCQGASVLHAPAQVQDAGGVLPASVCTGHYRRGGRGGSDYPHEGSGRKAQQGNADRVPLLVPGAVGGGCRK